MSDIIATNAGRYEMPNIPDKWHAEFNRLAEYLNTKNLSIQAALSAIYEVTDNFNKEFVSTFTVCKKGCSHCCKISVDVTTLEAEYISTLTRHPISSGRHRVDKGDEACQFLDSNSNECTIYSARPYKCRTLHTVDNPYYCESGQDHIMYGHSGLGFNNQYYNGLYQYILKQNGDLPRRYLSDFFTKQSTPSEVKI